ncbi:MAG TPA: amidohydrolase family protein [Candidatus Polarisedimenticolaceae bacterium]|nr:amidohydrolase family protein [Candidatus Polarisedimenticolaceae bacterium]
MISKRSGIRAGILVLGAVVAAGWLTARAARPRIYAITGATVVTAPGQKIESGTVVIRDGLIDAVGHDLAAPADAVVIDGKGKFVYAGFIDAGGWTPGADAPAAAPAERGRARTAREPETGPVYPVAAIRPERRIADTLPTFEGDRKRDADSWRRLGFTALLAAPGKGIFRGTSALVLLRDEAPVADLIVRDGVAQHLAFETGGFGDTYPNSLMGAAAAVRQALLDTQRYVTWSERYEKNPAGMPRPERLPALEALRPLLSRHQPVFFEAASADDILLADRIAREFDLDLVAVASGTEAEIADQVAKTGRVLVYPLRFPDKPKVDDPDDALDVTLKQLERYVKAGAAPKTLADAGIKLAFSAHGLKNNADFAANLRKVLDAGFPEDAALAALTVTPAKLLGVDRTMGTIEAGKVADLILTDGPVFKKDSKVRRVFVDGYDYAIDEKAKPKGDPNAVVDPRGTWSVVIEIGSNPLQRTWTIAGEKGHYTGTAETRAGVVTFDKVELAGNALTVTFPASEGRGANEVTVIVNGDAFEGTMEMGPRSAQLKGTRTHGPEGGAS